MSYFPKPVILIFFNSLILLSCTPQIYPPHSAIFSGQILETSFITQDKMKLPLKKWQPKQPTPKAIIIALHGFNDYSNFFQQPGNYFSQYNILSYAYDQRGFGGSPNIGLWAGVDTYSRDLKLFINLIKHLHPQQPIFLLGESMGAAVIINAAIDKDMPQVNGIILSAPAIWGRATMPWYQTSLLWLLSHTFPWMTLTGEGLEIMPSDNIEMLKALANDPLVIKETRVETLFGLVNLMDKAFDNASLLTNKALLLYGEKDEIIPKEPTLQFLQALPKQNKHIVFYDNGYHMLLRDLQATVLWNDVKSWILNDPTVLPSQPEIYPSDK